MATLVVDTHDFVKDHAEAIVGGIKELKLDHVATKEDLLEFKAELFKWLVPLLIGQAGLIAALVKLL